MDMPELDFDSVNKSLTGCCKRLKDLAAKRALARTPQPLTVSTIRSVNTTKTESGSDSDSDSKSGSDSGLESGQRVVDWGGSWKIDVIGCDDVEVGIASASPNSASHSASSASLMSASSSNAVQIGQSASLRSSLSGALVILKKKSAREKDSALAEVRAKFQLAGRAPSQFLHLAAVYEEKDIRVDVRAKCDLRNFITTHFDPRGSDYEAKNFTEFNARLSREFFAMAVMAVVSMHEVDLAHMDLKPENMLVYVDTAGRYYIKIIDFAESALLHHANPRGCFKKFLLRGGVGGFSRHYCSPEYRAAIESINFWHDLRKLDLRRHDCFSLGVFLDQLVWGENRKDSEFKELHSGLTQQNPEERYTLEQVMESKFFGSNPKAFFDEQAQYCCNVSIDNFVLSVPQKQDGFFFVPTTTKPVITDLEQLITQTNGLTWATKHVKQDAFTVIFMLKKTYERKKSIIARLEVAIKVSRSEEESKLLAELQGVVKGKALEVLDCAPNLEKALPYFAQLARLTVEDGPYKSVCGAVFSFAIDYCIKHPVAASTDHHAELFALLDELLAIQKNARGEQVPVILAKYRRRLGSDECTTFLDAQLANLSPERKSSCLIM